MSEQIKDGGQAFPVPSSHLHHKDGMTLRDYFAAKAMQGDCARVVWDKSEFEDNCSWAYMLADAMLRAREVKA